jgi:hypothetical protein
MENELIVPIEGLHVYVNHPKWGEFAEAIKSRLYNGSGKEFSKKKVAKRYKKCVKHLKKAAEFLPEDLMIEVRYAE